VSKILRRVAPILISMLLVGCIQPISVANQTQTAEAPFNTPVSLGPTQAPVATNPSPGVAATPVPPAASASVADTFVRSRGDIPSNIQVWYDQALGPDRVQGFSYTGQTGLPCAGFLLTAFINGLWQLNNGGLVCGDQPAAESLAAVTFFLASDGQPYTIAFGRTQNATITSVATVYADGSSQPFTVSAGGFLVVSPGVLTVARITAIDAQGFTVIDNIPQAPVR
jgi:hypothetical protein